MLLVRRKQDSLGRPTTYGDSYVEHSALSPIDAHAQGLTNRSIKTLAHRVTNGLGNTLDAYFWLPMAAERYDISRDLRDYVIVPNVPIILSDVPNTNGIAFNREELLKFNVKAARMGYKTFKGRPTFKEHQNSDHTKALGAVLDVYLDKVPQGRGILKVVELLAFDRQKDPELCKDILEKRRNCYSMGAFFGDFAMSDGSRPSEEALKRPLYCNDKNELVYKIIHDIEGFETSSVANPAFASATNMTVITL